MGRQRRPGAVFDTLRADNGAHASSADLTASLARVFAAGSDDLWLETTITVDAAVASHPFHSGPANALQHVVHISDAATARAFNANTISIMEPAVRPAASVGPLPSIAEVETMILRLPRPSRATITRIDLNPARNPDDAFWATQPGYASTNFTSDMTAGADGVGRLPALVGADRRERHRDGDPRVRARYLDPPVGRARPTGPIRQRNDAQPGLRSVAAGHRRGQLHPLGLRVRVRVRGLRWGLADALAAPRHATRGRGSHAHARALPPARGRPTQRGKRMSERPQHPGVIEFVDGTTGETTRREDAGQVPDSIKFVPDADGVMRAVVRVRMTTAGDRREIEQIAEDGTVLKRTYQRRVD